MGRYALNLPADLKEKAEDWAARQGVSLNQFILWAVAEKVGTLSQALDDPRFPRITYRRGASGAPTPVLRGTGIRVQTVVLDAQQGASPAETAAEYGVSETQVREAQAFYEAHRHEVDASVQAERELEPPHG
jgi:uncharacterized protein (DUF433 family)